MSGRGVAVATLALASALVARGAERGAIPAAPELVSPLSAHGESRVGSVCPTFSWTLAEGASGYEIVIYELGDSADHKSEAAEPVVRRTLPRGALSWTPTLDECLPHVGRYSWAVGALNGRDPAAWSAPGLFRVDDGRSVSKPSAPRPGARREPIRARIDARIGKPVGATGQATAPPGHLGIASAFVPAACGVAPFSDVPASSPYCPFIRQMVDAGISAGCGGGRYCPQGAVTREQLAMFLARVLRAHGVRTVDAGEHHTCAVLASDRAACWGYPDDRSTAPGGFFTSVSAGGDHSCGVRTDGTVACWGSNEFGQRAPPAGGFWSVSAGDLHTCGVQPPGILACWGDNSENQTSPLPNGTFMSVSAGGGHTCAVDEEGTLACWGNNSLNQAPESRPERFLAVAAGTVHTCGLKTDGGVVCWGDNTYGQTSASAGTFVSISAGNYQTCGVRLDGTLSCWGIGPGPQLPPPGGTFTAISAGLYHACGIRTDGVLSCWGNSGYGAETPPGWL